MAQVMKAKMEENIPVLSGRLLLLMTLDRTITNTFCKESERFGEERINKILSTFARANEITRVEIAGKFHMLQAVF